MFYIPLCFYLWTCGTLNKISSHIICCCVVRSSGMWCCVVGWAVRGSNPGVGEIFCIRSPVQWVWSSFSSLVFSMLASGTQVRGFKPSWRSRIFRAKKSSAFLRGEVKPSVPCLRFAACKRFLHLPWKSHAVGKIGSPISRPYFLLSLIEVSDVTGRGVPLEMMGETKSGAQRARS
jgi:hypothetical protein